MHRPHLAAMLAVVALTAVGCADDTSGTAQADAEPSGPVASAVAGSPPVGNGSASPATGGTAAANCAEAEQEVIADSAEAEYREVVTKISKGAMPTDADGQPLVDETVYPRYAAGEISYEDLPQPVPLLGGDGEAARYVVYCEGVAKGETPEGTTFTSKYITYGVQALEDGTLELVYQVDYLGADVD